MSILKSVPMRRIIAGQTLMTSQLCLVSDNEYTTNGECVIITKENQNITIKLDNANTDHIIIKALTSTKILPLNGLIDEEFNEINIEKGASIEMYYAFGNWYIVSSDGLKQS
jgi:hypothetical protein